MSFAEFLLKGPSFENNQYHYKTYTSNYNESSNPGLRERITSIWQDFNNHTKILLGSSLAIITVGITVIATAAIPPLWIAGGVLIVAALALAVFSMVRFIQSGTQYNIWTTDSFWKVDKDNTNSYDDLDNARQKTKEMEEELNSKKTKSSSFSFTDKEINLPSDDLDKEYKRIRDGDFNTKTQNSLYAQLAEKYYQIGNLEKALDTIRKVRCDLELENEFIAKLAEVYYQRGDLGKALDTIRKVSGDPELENEFIAKLAEVYYQRGNLDKAVDTIRKVSGNSKLENTLLIKVAEWHFQNDDFDKAVDVMDKVSGDSKTANTFFAKIAELHFQNNDLDKATKVIRKVSGDPKLENSFYAKIAELYYQRNEWKKALEVIRKVSGDSKLENVFLAKLAETHYERGDLENALDVTDKICCDSNISDPLLIKIAESYYHSNNFKKAFQAIKYVENNPAIKNQIIKNILISISTMGNQDEVVGIVKEIIERELLLKYAEYQATYNPLYHQNYAQTYVQNFLSDPYGTTQKTKDRNISFEKFYSNSKMLSNDLANRLYFQFLEPIRIGNVDPLMSGIQSAVSSVNISNLL